MPFKGRPRHIATKACGTKLFTDDLREVAKLTELEQKTTSDVLRDLVHEALVTRRQRAMGRDEDENYLRRLHQQAIEAALRPLERAIERRFRDLAELIAPGSEADAGKRSLAEMLQAQEKSWERAFSFLTEVLGFSMTAEMKTYLILQNLLIGRGLDENSARGLIAEHEAGTRQQTEKIVGQLLS